MSYGRGCGKGSLGVDLEQSVTVLMVVEIDAASCSHRD